MSAAKHLNTIASKPTSTQTLGYRPDIDGLRAIAVLSVLVFHLSETLLPGGFVGVDIFFVISGYLITRLIVREIHSTQQFRFGNFYLRRVRRLFPAMCATFLLCLLLSYALLSPQHLVDFGRSLIFAVLSVSNFYFWQSADYFDFASQSKPLLHTWSLSVEEQFYLLWPLTVLLLSKVAWSKSREPRLQAPADEASKIGNASVIVAFIALMSLASLALNTAWFNQQLALESIFSWGEVRSFAFYTLPFRLYEFGIGAALVFVDLERASRWLRSTLFVIGLGLIIMALYSLDSQTDFPSYTALLPCIGAGLLILAGPNHPVASLISNRVMVGIGLISYSLYLIHWPLIVFYRYYLANELNNTQMIGVFITSFVLAYLMYRFIEQPFRKARTGQKITDGQTGQTNHRATNNTPFLISSAIAAVTLIGIAFHSQASNGWLWRYPAAVVEELKFTRDDYANYFWQNIESKQEGFEHSGKPKVLVIGDSMAADLINVFIEGGSAEQLDLAAIKIDGNCKTMFALNDDQYQSIFGSRADICRQQHQKVFDSIEQIKQADAVILATFLTIDHFVKYVIQSAHFLGESGAKKVYILGQKTQQFDGMAFLAKMAFKPNLHKIKTPLNDSALRINDLLKKHAKRYEYIDLLPQFCSLEGCQRVTRDGHLIIFDGTHLSEQGARHVGRNLALEPWFKELLQTN